MLEVGTSRVEAEPATRFLTTVDEVTALLATAADKVDSQFAGEARTALLGRVAEINKAAAANDQQALYAQQFLLDRVYRLHTKLT
ncbi:iron-containing redox enzyme family protein, partial [Streptomyces sp. SID8455]|nr:iron-containing redox enzyme family protein [Streptomyces sp. SID8455]